MRILLVKTSSLGDVFHVLPALTDAHRAIPELQVDWVVEEAFKQIPAWHPAVNQVIPIAWRRWRKNLTKRQTWEEMRLFYRNLTNNHYDLVLDAQGLIKSALVTYLTHGPRCGLDSNSARESLASLAYNRRINIPRGQHAIHRLRQFFAECLDYDVPDNGLSYGINKEHWPTPSIARPYVVFLHGSTWETKLWPETYWKQLRDLAISSGYHVVIPWGNDQEQQRARRLADDTLQAHVFEKSPLSEIAQLLAHASAVIGVDTGLSHVAAALDTPTLTIYGATDPQLTGVLGTNTKILQSDLSCVPCLKKYCGHQSYNKDDLTIPCYQELTPALVWQGAQQLMTTTGT